MHQAITTWQRAFHKPHIILRIFKGLQHSKVYPTKVNHTVITVFTLPQTRADLPVLVANQTEWHKSQPSTAALLKHLP